MENCSCAHISSYKCTAGLNSYEILHAFYVCCIAKDSRRRKARDCLCMTVSCQTRYQRIHACLSCVYFGCYNGGHIHEHAKEEDHPLAIDTNFGYVFCFECGDYQYDADFDRIARKQKLTAARKKGEDVNFKWEPSAVEAKLLQKHVIINVDYIKGMRGIRNLGNTCYISVIILSLAHAPVFRDYLLSLKHKCKIQNISPESQVSEQVSALVKLKPVCFVCEMSVIVQEFFCGKLEPFIPDRVLYLLWLHADRFKNPGQHDAHEFFLILLDFLHLHHQGRNERDISSIDLSCNCIIDTIFTFSLHQEYTFKGCKHKLIHVNGSRGIFLELQSTHNDGVSSVTDKDTDSKGQHKQRTLIDFLKENQSEVRERTCESCNEMKEYHKITTLNRLPIILTFYLQQNGMHSNKLYVKFPEFLDMTPFMTKSSKENDKPENGLNNMSKNKFYLFAVVVHSESKDQCGGHYTCYVRRHKKEWFLMDNEDVTRVTIEKVLEAQACLLFYHKETLEFEDRKKVGL